MIVIFKLIVLEREGFIAIISSVRDLIFIEKIVTCYISFVEAGLDLPLLRIYFLLWQQRAGASPAPTTNIFPTMAAEGRGKP